MMRPRLRSSEATRTVRFGGRPRPQVDVWNRIRWGIVFAIGVGVVLYLTRSVIFVLLASAAAAYLLDPIVSRVARRGYTRDWAIFLVGLLGALLLTLLGLIVIPSFVRQFADLADNLAPYVEVVSSRVGPLIQRAETALEIDIPVDVRELGAVAPDLLKKLSPDMRATIQGFLGRIAGGGWAVIASGLSISLMPVFTFYLLRDWPEIVRSVDELVPQAHRPLVRRLSGEIDGRIGAFIRGQIFVAMILSAVYTVGLLISGIDLAFSMGLISGALFLLPYLGPVIAAVVSISLALLKFGLGWQVAVVVGTYMLAQFLENTFLTPNLIGDRVGLHPMVVVVAVVVAGNLMGIWGLILALPLTASLAVLVHEVLARYKKSRTYIG